MITKTALTCQEASILLVVSSYTSYNKLIVFLKHYLYLLDWCFCADFTTFHLYIGDQHYEGWEEAEQKRTTIYRTQFFFK